MFINLKVYKIFECSERLYERLEDVLRDVLVIFLGHVHRPNDYKQSKKNYSHSWTFQFFLVIQ